MNLKLFPNVVKVDFVVGTKELFRIQDEIKLISFNKYGSLVGLSTKQNKFYLFDFFGRSILGVITYFHENKYKINNFCFDDNNILYIAFEYESKENINIKYSGIKQINIEISLKNTIISNIGGKEENIIPIPDKEINDHEIFTKTTNSKIFEILFRNDNLLICGNNPSIYYLKEKSIFYFLKQDSISLTPLENDINALNSNFNKKKEKDKNKKKKKLDKENTLNNESENAQNNIGKESNNLNDNIENDEINSINNVSNDIITTEVHEKQYNPFTIFIRYGSNANTIYFIVKELYIFFIVRIKEPNKDDYSKFDEVIKQNNFPKNVSYNQNQFINFIKENLNETLCISNIYLININGEINHVESNTRNNLILINSSDRVVRLFEVINDSIILQKEYYDSVNKRKYTNCYFYTYKLNSGIQDLILMALNDSNGLELCFIDIVTGNIIKKLETFKYTVQDFTCHYQNHFSILIISGKKVFCINGVMANQSDRLAPGLQCLEENVEYIEEESFYDNFDEKVKQRIKMQNNHEEKIDEIFSSNQNKEDSDKNKRNIFVKVDLDERNGENNEREKSLAELKELFSFVGQQIQ
jgi:hypothetical protein